MEKQYLPFDLPVRHNTSLLLDKLAMHASNTVGAVSTEWHPSYRYLMNSAAYTHRVDALDRYGALSTTRILLLSRYSTEQMGRPVVIMPLAEWQFFCKSLPILISVSVASPCYIDLHRNR
jgi:hypothetical protein